MNESDLNGDGRDTREKLLDAAERLFAEQGFDSTSLRQITAAAGANLAAVNYHFGSKEDLIVEVLDRKIKPMNDGLCPYNENGKCTIHEYRFAGCRIFCCNGNADFQSDITESILVELKELCVDMGLDYNYRELSEALNNYHD